ncbi:MAG: hypothetical protein GF350_07130 [Chitinivibrionales bacterium]|nr:hypothetical protein [Chitinivibrionales bacterium]
MLNSDGTIRWKGENHDSRSFNGSAVADIDMDGWLEIIAVNTAYANDGSVLWHNSSCKDGLTAAGNFDDDIFAEIVLINRKNGGRIYLLEDDGTIKWGPVNFDGLGGPPVIADIDNDGKPEIGTAGDNYYYAIEHDGSLKWKVSINDNNGITGSSAFDFFNDGSSEILFSDQNNFFIFDGIDGSIRCQIPVESATLLEMPVVADVDFDNSAEIIIPANTVYVGGEKGLIVLGDADNGWPGTGKVWNQHSYHITNIGEDGQIPQNEPANHTVFNNYRENMSIPQKKGCYDITASYLRSASSDCADSVTLVV